jgi:Protein of unknown function (DUF4013)
MEDVLTMFTSQNLTALFSFPFHGPNWKQKLMLGSVMTFLSLPLLLIPAIFTAGYSARILRQVLNDQAPHLPQWDDWNQMLYDGLRVSAVNLIFMLPFILVGFAGYAVMVSSSILSAALLNGSEAQSGVAFTSFIFTTSLSAFGAVLFMLLGLVVSMLLPVAVTHMIACDSFSAAFHMSEWWPILRANLGEFVLIAILLYGAGLLFGTILQILVWTLVFCWLLPVISGAFGFTIGLITYAMYARAYREGAARVGSRDAISI